MTFNEKGMDIDETTTQAIRNQELGTQTALSLSSTSPRKVHLYRQIRGYKRQIANLELQLTQVKKAKSEDMSTLDKLLDKYFPKQTSEFLKIQARLFQKDAKGRRYDSDSFKQHCLSIYFASPKAYINIATKSKLFCLPSYATLQRFTRNCYINPGLQDNVFQMLKIKINDLPDINKYCILCIDEMSLTHLFYNITTDKVIGFEDIGYLQSCSQLLTHNVAVIIVKGICQSWKQPLSYFFLNSTMKASDLLIIIQETVRKLKNIGLKVVCLITDMGSNFYQLTKLLKIDDRKSYFTIDDEKIFYIFDPPHLLKASRNNLYQHNYVYEDNKIASWEHIEYLYAIDKKAQFRAAPRLTDSHINPNNFEKMKVKYAAQILSHSVSAAINTYVTLGSLSAAAIFTADFVAKFDKLFDILNSSKLYSSNPNKQAYTNTSEQVTFLNETKHFLQRLKVITKNGKDITNSVKSRKCWIVTINSILQLWNYLQESSVPI